MGDEIESSVVGIGSAESKTSSADTSDIDGGELGYEGTKLESNI